MEFPRLALRALACAALLPLLTGCPSKEERELAEKKRFGGVLENPDQSPQFIAFIGKLRKAVSARDYDMMVKLMTSNFGYDLEAPTEGPLLAIQYWNQYGLWPELERVLASEFSPKDRFVVAPPEFALATDKKPYTGFRAGVVDTSNGYRFAYFVSDQSFGPTAAESDPGAAYPAQPQAPSSGRINPTTYNAPAEDLGLPQANPTLSDGPRVIANPQDLEYNATPVPMPPGPLAPAP
jgi:hypothetical protein